MLKHSGKHQDEFKTKTDLNPGRKYAGIYSQTRTYAYEVWKWNHVEFNFKKLKNFDTQKFDIDKVLQRPFNLKSGTLP